MAIRSHPQIVSIVDTGKTIGFGNTIYYPLGGSDIYSDTVGNASSYYTEITTISKAQINVTSSSTSATLKIQKNGSDGSISLAIPSSTTGIFIDNTNSESYTTGDTARFKLSDGGGYPFTFTTLSCLASEDSSIWSSYQSVLTSSGQTGGDYYNDINGSYRNGFAYNSNAAGMPIAGGIYRLRVYISSNSQNASTTFVVNKNGTNTAITVTVPASTSGGFDDNTNTGTYSAGDIVTIRRTITGSGTITVDALHTSTYSSDGFIYVHNSLPATAGSTSYGVIAGAGASSTESTQQHKMSVAGTFSNLYIFIGSASTVGSPSVRLRINGTNGNIVIASPAGSSGAFSDTTHTDNVAVDDLVNFSVTAGSSGTHNVSSLNIAFLDASAPPAVPTNLFFQFF